MAVDMMSNNDWCRQDGYAGWVALGIVTRSMGECKYWLANKDHFEEAYNRLCKIEHDLVKLRLDLYDKIWKERE